MNPDTILIGIALVMLMIEIVLTIWHGRYMAKVFRKVEGDDAALFLQGRDTNNVAKEMRELLLRNAAAERK